MMAATSRENNSHRLATAAVCVLLALTALAFVAASSTPSHIHRAGTAGLYNAECPLAEFAARQGMSSLLSAPPSFWSDFSPAGVLLFAASRLSAPVALDAEPRAPPARLI
jgi:hypothetical protein